MDLSEPSSTIIPVHAIAASLVILLAPVNLLRRCRDAAHRLVGRVWVVSMYLVCVSGMFVYTIGGFTVFHALAIFTFATTTLGVLAIRRGNVPAHIGNMVGSWVGAVFAGAYAAFAPGRYLPTLAVRDPVLLWSVVAAIVAAATVWVWIVLARLGRGTGGERTQGRVTDPAARLPRRRRSGRAGVAARRGGRPGV